MNNKSQLYIAISIVGVILVAGLIFTVYNVVKPGVSTYRLKKIQTQITDSSGASHSLDLRLSVDIEGNSELTSDEIQTVASEAAKTIDYDRFREPGGINYAREIIVSAIRAKLSSDQKINIYFQNVISDFDLLPEDFDPRGEAFREF